MHRKRAHFQRGVVIPVIAILLPILAVGLVGVYLLMTKKPTPAPPQPTPTPRSGKLGFGQIDVRVPVDTVEVTLSYSASSQPQVHISQVLPVKAFVPTYPEVTQGYRLELINSDNTVLASQQFVIPNKSEDLGVLNGLASQGRLITFDTVNFALTLAADKRASNVRLVDPNGATVETRQLAQARKPRLAIRIKAFVSRNLHLGAKAQGNAPEFVDIAVVSANYSQANMAAFRNDFERVKTYVLNVEPYKSRANQIKFFAVETTQDMGCSRPNASARQVLVCDHAKVSQAVRTASVPSDAVMVLVNDPEYGGAAYIEDNMGFVSNSSEMPKTFTHELGHALSALDDEYSYNTIGTIDNATHQNCYAGTPPAQAWQGIVQSNEYAKECHNSNWYRSSPNSIMRSLSFEYYNEISKRIINARIDKLAGGRLGTIPPTGTPRPTGSPNPSASPTIQPSPSPSGPPSPTPKPSSSTAQGYTLTLRKAGCLQGQARVNWAVTQPLSEGSELQLFLNNQPYQTLSYLQPPGSSGTFTNLPPNVELRADLHKSPLRPLAPGQLGFVTAAYITTEICP